MTTFRTYIHVAGLTMLLSLSAPALAQTVEQPGSNSAEPDRFESVRQYIRTELEEHSLPSLAVAVAKDGKIIWEEGFGWADTERKIPADANTPYSLASISKPITATGLMTLVRDGKLDLDQPANNYLGEAKLIARVGDANHATVRRIADHTSGLPLHYQFFYVDEAYPRPEMDETLRRYGNLVTVPGEHYQYSNLGYGVLDYIIERVSKQSYADFMQQQVFQPLGMSRSSVDITPALKDAAATRYGPDGLAIPFYTFDHPGGSAVYASAHDLVRFGMFHLKNHLPDQKPILSDALIDQMHQPTQQSREESGDAYGIGFGVSTKHGITVVDHSGGMAGVSTQLWLLPEHDLAIVALANAGTSLPGETADRIAAILVPGWKVESPDEDTQQDEADEDESFAPPAELAGRWQGTVHTYQEQLPITLDFLPRGQVQAQLGDQLIATVHEPEFKDGRFSGYFVARIGTPDTERYHNVVKLDQLTLRGQTLNGAAIAQDQNDDNPRVRNALGHWIELNKKK